MTTPTPFIDTWIEALRERHASGLRFPEIRKGLQALSGTYVERRDRLGGELLSGAGKRAAFALYYGPIHFLLTQRVVQALSATDPPPRRLVDLGCGLAAASCAWALEAREPPYVLALDSHPWCVEEARFTLAHARLSGRVLRGDIARGDPPGGDALIAAFVINELTSTARQSVLGRLCARARHGDAVLVLEPIARRPSPWWDDWARCFAEQGGRADEWRFAAELPGYVAELARAAGLDPRELTARSLWVSKST